MMTFPTSGARRVASISRKTRSSGFTIIELLVAAGITAMIAGFLAVIISNVSKTWIRSNGRLGTDAQARIILDQLQVDLQGAMFRDDGNVWFAANVLDTTGNSTLWQVAARNPKPTGAGVNGSLQMTTPNIADARFGMAGVWLRFFTTSRGTNTAATPTTISAPVAVGYQIIRRFTATNPANIGTAYLLHRAEARPAASSGRIGVLEAGYNITSANYTTSTSSTNSGSITGDPRTIQVPGSARNLDSVLGDNVIDFGVRCYVRDATLPGGLRLIFPATASGTLSNASTVRLRSTLPASTPVAQLGTAQPFPDVVDVMVRILTDEGATLIAGKVESGTDTPPAKYNSNAQQWWWGIAQENSRVYTRRIVLNAKPL